MNSPEHAPTTIAVDLTPVLPGGENGGAKVLALALVPLLAELARKSRFILLTTRRNDNHLAHLDAVNVRRFCVDAPAEHRSGADNFALRLRSVLAPLLPKRGLAKLAESYHALRNAQGNSLMRQLGAQVLFSPFLGIPYHDGRTPLVAVVADLQFVHAPEFFAPRERERLAAEFSRIAESAARIVCVSEYVRSTVVRAGAPPERTVVIHHALHRRFDGLPLPRCEDVLGYWALLPGEYLLYPANFWPHKNHQRLLEAFALFVDTHSASRLKLVLTGAGDGRARIEEALRGSAIANRVVIAGFVSDAELHALLRCSLALVFPSLYEGFGMPIVEAMVAGTPVLCSNGTSLPEIAGGAALLFDPNSAAEIANAIGRIAADPELRHRLTLRGMAAAAHFGSPISMAGRYWETICDAAITRGQTHGTDVTL
jgi:glycosyltransferase involved in cell wall biosynthesis